MKIKEMLAPAGRCCGNCKWWEKGDSYQLIKTDGEHQERRSGHCQWPTPELADSITSYVPEPDYRAPVYIDDGKSCPVYTQRKPCKGDTAQ